MKVLIGLDCGGTHIVGQTWSATDHQLLNEITGGPGNVVLDPHGALVNLTTVIDQLIAAANNATVDLILLGIAGVETAGSAPTIQQTLQQRYRVPIRVISDAKLALLNGLSGQDGTLVIAGTGSVVYGRQARHFLRVGGWGFILGDEGSAYDIAKTALKAVLNRTNAGQESTLTSALIAALNTDSVPAAVRQFYAQDRKTNAKLALTIAQLADQGNAEAQAVLTTTTTALATQITTLYQRYQAPQPETVALSGSVLQRNPRVRALLVKTIHATLPQLKFIDITTNNAHAVVYWHHWEPNYREEL